MSEKRYPTRMHEVLGVEVDEEFEIIDYPGVTFLVPGNGWMYVKWPSGRHQIAGQDYWASAINHGITRRPRLSEEQVRQMQALVTLGFKWLCQDSNDFFCAYVNKPTKGEFSWKQGGHYVLIEYGIPAEIVTSLVSWSDPEPLDIVQTLRDAGVEVES